MIDRKSVLEYDRFRCRTQNSIHPECRLPSVARRLKLWKNATVLVPLPVAPTYDEDFDVVIAGGGPCGVLFGAMLADRGHEVLLVEMNETWPCCVTWNLSHDEFENLSRIPVLSATQWRTLVVGDYTEGVFRIYDETDPPGQTFKFDHILNISVDEKEFFSLLGRRPGITVRFGTSACFVGTHPEGAFVRCMSGCGENMVRGRLFIDARGCFSPLAELVNGRRVTESVYNMVGIHTVGDIPWELNEDGTRPVGLICSTFENEIPIGSETPVQPIFERFTDFVGGVNRGDVFYYFTRTADFQDLAPMLDHMVEKIAPVAPGFSETMVDKTYYGHAAGYYQPTPFGTRVHQTSAGDRTLMIGVAAQQYSGLTGCAFGALARNAFQMGEQVDWALRNDRMDYATLSRIDIDPRERASQAITDLFAGTMELAPHESPGSVNRDWVSVLRAADQLDPQDKNDMFKDKVRLPVLNRMLSICMRDPTIIMLLIRNNAGRVSTVVWTFLRSYFALLAYEGHRLVFIRKGKYLRGIFSGVVSAPLYLKNSLELLRRAGKMNKQRLRKQQGRLFTQ